MSKWQRRFVKDRIEGLTDEFRPGRPRTVADEQVAEGIEPTLNTALKDATHWSIRSMTAETGLSHTTIWRIWNAFGLQPHRSETFQTPNRSAGCGQGAGHHGSVFVATELGYRVVRRREIPDSGAGSRTAGSTHGTRRG